MRDTHKIMRIYTSEDLDIDVVKVGPLRNNVGIVDFKKANVSAIIDAPMGLSGSEYITDKNITHVLLTHEHWDHIWDSVYFQDRGAIVFGHFSAQQVLHNPDIYPDDVISRKLPSCPEIATIQHKDQLNLFGVKIEVIGLEGHAPGDLGFYFSNEKICFVGDTLFAKTVGRSDFPGGDKRLLFKNIRERLYSLPDDVQIVPGHGYLTTVGDEKTQNPFVRPLLV